jgi:hypothetical protein
VAERFTPLGGTAKTSRKLELFGSRGICRVESPRDELDAE